MTLRPRVLVAVAVSAVLLMLAVWFGTNFERVPVEVETGMRGEARRDALLAARRLFEVSDKPAQFMPYRSGLPPRDGTLILLSRPQNRPGVHTAEVEQWVRAGGHVVVAPRRSDTDPLLAPWSVSVETTDEKVETLRASLLPGETLELSLRTRRRLEFEGARPLARAGEQVLVFRHGRGLVTALADTSFFTNRHIGKADNAAFLWRLAHFGRFGDVWFVSGESTREPWKQLARRAAPLLVALLALLLAYAWARARRFGPMLPESDAAPPQLVDHIRASGAFGWRNGARAELLEAARDSVLRTIEFRRPGWLAAGDRDEQIARLCGLSRARVAAAFADIETLDKRSFTDAVEALEIIRKSL